MKKLLTFCFATFVLCSLYSCKKTYRCSCYGGVTGSFVGQSNVKATNTEKARIECDALEANGSNCIID
jgi:hypothetical protein